MSISASSFSNDKESCGIMLQDVKFRVECAIMSKDRVLVLGGDMSTERASGDNIRSTGSFSNGIVGIGSFLISL